MIRLRSVAGFVILLCGIATLASAQGTADIVGRVVDASGLAIPGATVTARDLATNVTRTTVTSATGDYAFTALPVGQYEVKTELSSFKTETSRVTLATGDRARVDVQLEVGAVNESVEVAGNAQQLQTDESHVASNLNPQVVESVPVIGRNIINLVQLTPGAAEGNATATISGNRPDDRRQTSAVAVAGMPENENRQMIDGVDNEERVMGGMGIKPSLEAIQEVNVQTNSFAADKGRTLAAVINVITKSGGNEFHGSAYEFFRNQNMDARTFFAPVRPLNHQNQFGGSVGGPIRKNKTFFFIDYDNDRINNQYNSIISVPTDPMHTGDFSGLLPGTLIYDPLTGPGTRTPFPGNIIPASRFDPRAVNLMQLYPQTNLPGLVNNFTYNGPQDQHNQTADLRIDQHFDEKNTLFARYSYNLTNGVTASQCPPATVPSLGITIDPTCNTGGTVSLYSGPYHSYADQVTVNYLHIFSPTLLGSFTYAFDRPYTGASNPANTPFNAAQIFGFQNVNYANDPVTGGLPWFQINPTSYGALGDPTFIPMETSDDDHEASGSLTWTKGSHSIKTGAGAVFRFFGVQQSQYPRSTYIFDSSLTNNGSGGGGNPFASFLLGDPSQEQRIHFPITPSNRSEEPYLYVMDDWHVTHWLTLNLGLRYEIYTPITEGENRISVFNPATGSIILASNSNPTAGIKTDYSDWGPRAGFAASLPGKLVFRGGMGIVYDPVLRGAGSFDKNAPFTENFGPYISNGTTGGGLPSLSLEDNPPPLVYNSVTNPAGTLGSPVLNYKAPRSTEYNGFLEKQLGGFVISAGYVGYYSDRYPLSQNINLPPIGPGAVNPRRPWYNQYPQLTTISEITNLGIRTYNSGQFKLQRRYANGLTLDSSLVWGHAQENLLEPWNPLQTWWGNVPVYDIRLKWVGMASYDIPFGSNLHGVAHGFLGGWQANFVAFWSTGIDYTIDDASSQTNQGLSSGGDEGPNVIPGCNPNAGPGTGTVQKWFNTSCWTLNAPLTVGNQGFGTMHGPPQRRLDIALAKSLHITEKQTLYLRIESYNITNTPSFQPPGADFGSATFGVISSTGNAPPRQMQLGVKYIF